ncbi:MAG: nucleotidyl transferase AbiEii/AbiGii toxin family protein [Sodaliphilus sp.]
MKLHEDKSLFTEIILRASQPKENGGLGINAGFIEKDYWITKALYQLSRSNAKPYAVFKGGTSLSKIFHIGSRFSEDVDVAIVKPEGMSDSKLKSMIRSTEKTMSEGLTAVERPGLTSKGSRYRKTYYTYPSVGGLTPINSLLYGQLLIEINSFANPYPFGEHIVSSFIRDYLKMGNLDDIIEEFDLGEFTINVLDKRTTLTEKLVALIRFSLAENPRQELAAKIRHFYDIYHLLQDKDCMDYLNGEDFKRNFCSLLNHDREMFAKPDGWQTKHISESPLIYDFESLWDSLSDKYQQELPPLAYSTIPLVSKITGVMHNVFQRVHAIGENRW